MENTSLSLLEQLCQDDQSECWDRWLMLYGPLMRSWFNRFDVSASDTDDLTQEVLLAVSRGIKEFQHRGHPGAFRGWLKTILLNCLRKHWRKRDRSPRPVTGGDFDRNAQLESLGDPSSELSQAWNREHDQFVLRQVLSMTEPHFAPATWQAFYRVALKGEKHTDVAADLEISLNSVCLAKSRVLRRLRQEAEGLIESSSDFLPPS